ncbi:MAG TPA: amidohydrolase family protein [Burkholderiales bacterium]|nr:amidohydrolase family protein [Burkholderiales bacterium]
MMSDASTAPACLGPDPTPEPPAFPVPPGAWDTHFHVFGPTARFPYATKRKYTPPDAPVENYFALAAALGIARGVCVHPNLHGADNAVTLDAVRRSQGRFVAIVKLDDKATLADVRAMHDAGARGARFAFNPEHGGELDPVLLERVIAWAHQLGWCLEMHMAADELPKLGERLAALPVPVIIDHMARVDPSLGVDHVNFRTLLDLVRLPHVWVKLSGADRITKLGPPYDDVVPYAQALIAAASDRMIWGTDWPHSGIFDPKHMPNDGAVLNVLERFAPDADIRKRILVDNPARLFGG